MVCRLAVIEPTCEYAINPLGIDAKSPRLGWKLTSEIRGEHQSAYQILVSQSYDKIVQDVGDLWDSEKVTSGESVNIACEISPLLSGQRYWWKVRVWDSAQGEPSEYCPPAFWEMGLLHTEDWAGATWIGGATSLRGAFSAESSSRQLISARLYVAGLGLYEARINGARVGDRVLSPAWTDYEKRILYDTYDVTSLVRKDAERNEVTIDLGKGRYPPAKEKDQTIAGYGPSKAIALIVLKYDDGTVQRFGTDTSWVANDGPIVEDDVYAGETFDARLLDSTAELRPCKVVEPPKGALRSSATLPPIRIVGCMPARRILFVEPGVYTFDFGQNFSGWVRLRVRGARGSKITLRYAELLGRDGRTINARTNEKAASTDAYIMRGAGLGKEQYEEYEPRFTYHGFRYVQVSGLPSAPSLETLEGRIVHTDVSSSGGFICSDPLINQIHANVRWTQLSNLMGLPTDCPQRNERLGWLGDAAMSSEEAMLNFWMPTFYEKWLRDIEDTQAKDGSINGIAPACWERRPAEPSWGMAYFLIPYELYLYYGDRRVLEEHYVAMKRYFDFILSMATEDGILEFNRIGDYCSPYRIRSLDTPGDLISTWVLYLDAMIMLKVARITSKGESEVSKFQSIALRIQDAFNTRFLRKRWDRGGDFLIDSYGDTQTSNVLPLSAGMVPPASLQGVLESLLINIVRHHDNHLDTGIIGTKYLFSVLSSLGHADTAYDIARQTTYPGYGYMISEGATTLWERWEYVTSDVLSSHNHIMFGSIDAWFYRFLGGINADESNPGFRHAIIRPHAPRDLRSVAATVETVRGQVISVWEASDDDFRLRVSIPANTTASVCIPKNYMNASHEIISLHDEEEVVGANTVFQNGRATENLPQGITRIQEEERYLICEVLSGTYDFLLRGKRLNS